MNIDTAERQYIPDSVEEWVFKHWYDTDAYEKTKAQGRDGEPYFFADGPPYTSSRAHLGTLLNKTMKDAYIRYLRMQGFDVYDRPGFDMHGLPIETNVEERLGFDNKKDIEKYGTENFIQECKAFAYEQLRGQRDDFRSFGIWMDWNNPYTTVAPEYMEITWWSFKQIYEQGLVYSGKDLLNHCPRCETTLAKNEVKLNEVSDTGVYLKIPLHRREGFLAVWAGEIWTIPAHTFIAVDKNLTYQKILAQKGDDTDLIYIAELYVEDVLRIGRYRDHEVQEELPGTELIGWEYEHPLAEEVPGHPSGKGALQIHHSDHESAGRTGLVHCAPGHNEDDFVRGKELELELFCPVGSDGNYTAAAGKYESNRVYNSDNHILSDLYEKGFILAERSVRRDRNQCWRCDTDVIQIISDQWFISVANIEDDLLEKITDAEWYPQYGRDKRFHDQVEGAPDWNISRQRYWGIPIPIWTPEDGSSQGGEEDILVIGTRKELSKHVDQDIDPESIDLHKPTVDELTITEDGTTYTRISDVFDVWVDSAVTTWATFDYPLRNAETFEEFWPADLVIEGHDQTTGWLWSQFVMGTVIFGEIPYERVLMHGHILDEEGSKMSYSIGNTVSPSEVINRHGRDATRLFLLSATSQGDDIRFSWDGLEEAHRRLNILWSAFFFPIPHMRIDDFDPAKRTVGDVALEIEDEWILSRLQTVKTEVTPKWESFEQDKAIETLFEFVINDVSRYYIQIIRNRIWKQEKTDSKVAAYTTIYTILKEVVTLLAPFIPFIAEKIYQHLTGDTGYDTIQMCSWPEPEAELQKPALEDDIVTIRDIEHAGKSSRGKIDRGLRWPVNRVIIDTENEEIVSIIERYTTILADRLNTHEIKIIRPGEQWEQLRYSATPNMSKLGPAFQEYADDIRTVLNQVLISEPSVDILEETINQKLNEPVELHEEMVEFNWETPDEVLGSKFNTSKGKGAIYIDTTITNEIESEGYAREVIRRVQEMRRDLELRVDQEIRLDISVSDKQVEDLIEEHIELIKERVRATELGDVDEGHERMWDVMDITIRLAIEPVA